jgi:hypothetical protein
MAQEQGPSADVIDMGTASAPAGRAPAHLRCVLVAIALLVLAAPVVVGVNLYLEQRKRDAAVERAMGRVRLDVQAFRPQPCVDPDVGSGRCWRGASARLTDSLEPVSTALTRAGIHVTSAECKDPSPRADSIAPFTLCWVHGAVGSDRVNVTLTTDAEPRTGTVTMPGIDVRLIRSARD